MKEQNRIQLEKKPGIIEFNDHVAKFMVNIVYGKTPTTDQTPVIIFLN